MAKGITQKVRRSKNTLVVNELLNCYGIYEAMGYNRLTYTHVYIRRLYEVCKYDLDLFYDLLEGWETPLGISILNQVLGFPVNCYFAFAADEKEKCVLNKARQHVDKILQRK